MEVDRRNSTCPFWDEGTYMCKVENVEPRIACNPYKMKRMSVEQLPENYHKCIFYILNKNKK